MSISTEIPRRALFKGSEVCEIAQLQPYVLRTWEGEFPDLGVSRAKGGPRIYRRADVERVLHLKQLLFVEGLTLAGARRKLEESGGPAAVDEIPTLEQLVTRDVREQLDELKADLRALLGLLSPSAPSAAEFLLTTPGREPGNGQSGRVRKTRSRRVVPRRGKNTKPRGRSARA